ncbi:Alpha/beta_hydrolase family protein [Hexamita inflata]|uniref:Alpha/beta hydrolase family protein n=1 Tax=Hexamita inflata TaxID=28002 RepID=A0AA86VL46_9EUKA|nr:Alpha/beta hydrolase family protein [Hexamita inflata]
MEVDLLIPINQDSIFCKFTDRKSEEAVIMIHGIGGSLDAIFFTDIAQNSQKSTIRFDFPGHGRSPGTADIRYQPQADIVLQLKDYLRKFYHVSSFCLVGHSKGATVAVLSASKQDTVVSVCGRINLTVQPVNRFSKDELEMIQNGQTVTKQLANATYEIKRDSFEERKYLEKIVVQKYKQIQKVIIVHGDADEITPLTESIQLGEEIGQKVIVCKGRGHCDLQWEDCADQLSAVL